MGEGIHGNAMPPTMQRVKTKRSQHISCVVIASKVSEVGKVLFDMADVAVVMLCGTGMRRRSIGLIGLKLIGFVKR